MTVTRSKTWTEFASSLKYWKCVPACWRRPSWRWLDFAFWPWDLLILCSRPRQPRSWSRRCCLRWLSGCPALMRLGFVLLFEVSFQIHPAGYWSCLALDTLHRHCPMKSDCQMTNFDLSFSATLQRNWETAGFFLWLLCCDSGWESRYRCY